MLTRTTLHLFEADLRLRELGRRASESGSPQDFARHAAERLRAGHHPFDVAHGLPTSAHDHLAEMVTRDHPVFDHINAFDLAREQANHHVEARQADNARRAHLKRGWHDNAEAATLDSIRSERAERRTRRELDTAAKGLGRESYEYASRHPKESEVQHRGRLLGLIAGWGRHVDHDGEHHLLRTDDPEKNARSKRAILHHYGDTHRVTDAHLQGDADVQLRNGLSYRTLKVTRKGPES